MTNCVGFETPIDFKPGAVFDWLESAQLAAKKVINLYDRNFHVDDFGVTESNIARVRAQAELDLQRLVLPQLDLNFMAVSPIEYSFSRNVYVNNSSANIPQSRGSCTEETP